MDGSYREGNHISTPVGQNRESLGSDSEAEQRCLATLCPILMEWSAAKHTALH